MLNIVEFEEIIRAVIKAVDVVNPILKHHHRRTAIIAYHLGCACRINKKDLANLVVATTLHDIGALTVESSMALAILDVEEPNEHMIIGASMLSSYKAFESISHIIRHHHVKYKDYIEAPQKYEDISYLSLILHLADRIEILLDKQKFSINQLDRVETHITKLEGDTFAPELLEVFADMIRKEEVWFDVDNMSLNDLLDEVDMSLICTKHDLDSLEELVYTLSKIIDYKCSYTAAHSIAVAYLTYAIAKLYGLDDESAYELKIAGYLHDIGKIGIATELIQKPGNLTEEEFNIMKAHPYFSKQILKSIRGFEKITKWASSHHETLDQTGYPCKPESETLGVEVEILTYADVFTALCEDRPYRKAYTVEKALEILESRFKDKVGNEVLAIVKEHSAELDKIRSRIQTKAYIEYEEALIETLYNM